MRLRIKPEKLPKLFYCITLGFCVLLIVAVVFVAAFHGGNDLSSFSEPVLTLSEGWTLTDSAGHYRFISLPETIEYGEDGRYDLRCILPAVGGTLTSPALRFYSNYVDLDIHLDGVELYSFPGVEAAFSGATGNTYHFVRLPSDYAGRTLTVSIRGQLGRDITYLLNPPLLGSKATMLRTDVMNSLPSLTLSACMGILAIGLTVLYLVFHRWVERDNGTLYTALFSLLFAVYVAFETLFAQLLMPNGYLLVYATLTLLALVPVPLIGIFINDASREFKPIMYGFMALCFLNILVQTVLNFTGVMSVRAMLPATHAVIIISIIGSSLCLLLSDRKEKPGARRSLYSALPMIAGGMADIVLLNLNRPSPNNCFFFALGVVVFIIYQLYGFISNYFKLYSSSLESRLLTQMAYHDALSGIGNRNAYERRLKELSCGELPTGLCCIVMDINDLKLINDTLGHQAGDTAIAEVGAVLRECMPEGADYFRTGGDEFVVLLDSFDAARARLMEDVLYREVKRHGELKNMAISLAIGSGQYEEQDGNIIDFIRRVDTLMYECKRRKKAENAAAAVQG